MNHFSACPEPLFEMLFEQSDIQHMMDQIREHQNIAELLRELLSALSADVHTYLTTEGSGIAVRVAEPFTFVCSPEPGSSANGGQSIMPGTLGVRPVAPSYDEGIHQITKFPHHLVETFVADEALSNPELAGRALRRYARSFLSNNPDRTGIYCLDLVVDGFQVYYADFMEFACTEPMAWDDDGLKVLMSYVYSLYDPPARHYTRDPTMVWREGHKRSTMSIVSNGEVFPDVRCIFAQPQGGKGTQVFIAGRRPTRQAVIKECYRGPPFPYQTERPAEGFMEVEILTKIHQLGFVPGVVRLAHHELVPFGGPGQAEITTVHNSPRVKHRMVLADVGESLLRAKSVNDLLKAVYDALEVHRTLANRAKVLHRDMSINNILMYPRCAQATNAQVFEDIPPFIDDVLDGSVRIPGERVSRCLLIDFDLAMILDDPFNVASEELGRSVGTSMYVARAAAVGRAVFARHKPLHMPELSEKAEKLYLDAYGFQRLIKYNDGEKFFHGGCAVDPGDDAWASAKRLKDKPYEHRWEYDVESVYWTMYSALLRVLPQGYIDKENSRTTNALRQYWHILCSHEFLKRPGPHECENLPQDTRTPLLDCPPDAFIAPFPPIMLDVARLLFDIAQHVRIPYTALFPEPQYDDHLHEAVQRLILNYLVRHTGDPIMLTPGRLRISTLEADVGVCLGEQDSAEEDADWSFEHLSEGTAPADGTPVVSPLLTGTWSYPYFKEDELSPASPVSE